MVKWKALLAGVVVVVPLVLLLQFLFTSLLVGQRMVHGHYPQIEAVTGFLPYLIGFGGFLVVMLLGGYVTAAVATRNTTAHALAVAALTTGVSLWGSISTGGIKPMTLGFFLAALLASAAGAWLWRKRNDLPEAGADAGAGGEGR